jgi:hypothetical protein
MAADSDDGKVVVPAVAPATAPVTPPPVTYEPTPAYFEAALLDSERLLKYAAENGIAVDAATRDSILQARLAHGTAWTEANAANLIAALTTLASLLRPVTAASLKAFMEGKVPSVPRYLSVAVWLAAIMLPFSVLSFLATSISTSIRADIATANDLAVKLTSQLGYPQVPLSKAAIAGDCPLPSAITSPEPPDSPPNSNRGEIISELQTYAASIRSIDSHATQLKVLVPQNWWPIRYLFPNRPQEPCKDLRKDPMKLHALFQLPAGIPNLAQAAEDRTTVYQDVRSYAQETLDDESFFYGAITTCILPVLYALLGTCAYLLRNFEQQLISKSYTRSSANWARFLIAGIGGLVVGLFNNLTTTTAVSISPLALAFLVGYAVDVFFAFLEGLLVSFTRSASSPPSAKG